MINTICGPNTTGCTFTVPTSCVIYDGPSTINIGYLPSMKLTDLLLLIDSKMAGVSSGTFFEDTSTTDIQGVGISSNPYSVHVKVSDNINNLLSVEADGLYAAASAAPDLQSVTDTGNSTTNSISIQSDGNLNSTANSGLYLYYSPLSGGSSFIWSGNPDGSGGGTVNDLLVRSNSMQFTTDNSTTFQNGGTISVQSTLLSISSNVDIDTGALGTVNINSNSTDITGGTELLFASTNPVVFRSNPAAPATRQRVKGANATEADDFTTLSQVLTAVPTLQQVTEAGNTTTTGITLDSTLTSNPLRIFAVDNSNRIEANVSASTTNLLLVNTGGTNNILSDGTLNTLTLGNVASTVSNSINLHGPSATNTISFTGNSAANRISIASSLSIRVASTDVIVFRTDGTVSGSDAISSTDFVTLQQLSTVPTIYTSDGTLSSDRSINMNSNFIAFDNASSFIVGTDMSAQFSLNGNSLSVNDGAGGTLGLSGGNFSTTAPNGATFNVGATFEALFYVNGMPTLTVHDTVFSSGIAGTFNGRVVGSDAINGNEFITLNQLNAFGGTIIDDTLLASTDIDEAYMNGNFAAVAIGGRVLFTNLSDDATKVLTVNKLTSSTWSANSDTKLI